MSIGLLILIGITLRLLIMPFFAHIDLFSEFRRVVYSISNDIYFPQQNRLVTFYIEYFFLTIFLSITGKPGEDFLSGKSQSFHFQYAGFLYFCK